ncbi:MAG: methyltransferase domain-containing protein [Rhodococcus sp. (in: high G+C Gram-positive bacteria)]|uniref:methyltransferase domain-containing protein n=1 Tax=Rhodococcus sp. TaxID=1831 RepID=UPI003BB567FB
MLDAVIDLLACPQCGHGVELDRLDLDRSDLGGSALLCERGHNFDVAKQGYVSLLTGAATKFSGDTADMIAARGDFLAAGHYDPIRHAAARACGASGTIAARVLEVGAGTGQYLAVVLDELPDSRGIGVDVSKPAVRRIARSHPRVGAVLADAWRQLPVRSGSVSHVLSIFAPRNAAETHRVLEPGGRLVVVTPTSEHLRELVALPGMVQVDDRKAQRLGAALSGGFDRADRREVRFSMALPHPDLALLVGMGPSAHHVTADRRAALLAGLPEPFTVTASVAVSVWTRRD